MAAPLFGYRVGNLWFFTAVIIWLRVASSQDEARLPTVAIVGGGIGGASCAHHLRQLFGQAVPIVVFEAEEIGGRAKTVTIGGMQYEAGASIIHPLNKEMVSFQEALGLKKKVDEDGTFAFYDGSKITFQSSQSGFLTNMRMLWRYGLQLLTLNRATKSFMDDFERIYGWQQELQAFTTVPNLLLSMSDEVLNSTQHELRRSLLDGGWSELLVDELVAAAVKVNYGQMPQSMHSFVGHVALAGMTGDLWSVSGGNKQVAEGLLRAAKATVLTERVLSVELLTAGDHERPSYRVATNESERTFDIVFLAVPFVENSAQNIKLVGFATGFSKIERQYQRIVSTFVRGVPNVLKFGYSVEDTFPDAIFVTAADSFFNALSLQSPVNSTAHQNGTYKVFSPEPLSSVQLDDLFSSRTEFKAVDWLAYPHYSQEASFPPIVLHKQLYYVNALETAASAMETAAIAGHNTAQLAFNQWLKLDHLVDNMFVIEEKHIKIEL